MRIYELAKELGLQSKELLAALKKQGHVATTHMMVLTDEQQVYLEKEFAPKPKVTTKPSEKVAAKKAEEPSRPTITEHIPAKDSEKKLVAPAAIKEEVDEIVDEEEVEDALPVVAAPVELPARFEDFEAQEAREQERIKRLLQATGLTGSALGQSFQGPRRRRRRRPRPVRQEVEVKKNVTELTVEKSMPLFEVAELFGKSSGDLILALLRKGIACNRNYVLGVDVIRALGEQLGVAVTVKKTENKVLEETVQSGPSKGITRWPVVVVMGHVDHGKTTLLDYVRKMNVAATEKGGITQHIRAWEVESKHGKIVFLDTPGHEAFSYLRQRGSSITDLVILVVAVDDGIKPQTIEAIDYAKSAGVPIIVAVNKMDKMSSPAAFETIKRQLAQHDLMPEDWGGQTVVVPISAKTGQGIEDLLELLVLQSQILDLRSEPAAQPRAFVLESNIEKGLGPVATVVVKDGTLKLGDYFISGTATGKIRILMNSMGKRITQAGPSMPAMVVGFDDFSGIGDWVTVVPQQEYAKARSQGVSHVVEVSGLAPTVSMQKKTETKMKSINLIIKVDTRGSKEAVMDSIDKLVKQHKDIKCPVNIVVSSIGDISESDIDLAENTDAIILGLHVRTEKNAQLLAKDRGVDLQVFYIIYELIDYLSKLILSHKEVIMTWTKVGEAVVKKVFDIKGVGIIAGCYMRDGVLSRGNRVACMRAGRQVGEGVVTSLQRDRKSVKEIHAGYECGFTCEGFTEWQEGDTVICSAEMKDKSA